MTGRPDTTDPALAEDLATLREVVRSDEAGWDGGEALDRVEAELSRLREERDAANERASKLNRRATQAEAVVMQTVEDCKRQGVSFGRALANSACNHLQARAEAAEDRCARLQQAYDRAEDERLQLRAAFYRLQDQLGRAYECCARPSGTCFDPEVLTTSVPGSSAADVDGSEKRESAARGHHESVGERQGRQPGTEALAGPGTPADSGDLDELKEAFAEVVRYLGAYRKGAPAGPEVGWAIRNFNEIAEGLREDTPSATPSSEGEALPADSQRLDGAR